MELRYASEKDSPFIAQLMNELGYETDVELIKNRLEKIRQRNGRVIVAVDENGDIVGCVHVFIDLRLAEGEMGEIVSLVVKKELRGKGTGTKLLNKARGWVQDAGCKKIRIRANAIREEAHQFYKEQGFEEVKSQKIFQLINF